MRLVHGFSPFEEVCVLFDEDGCPAAVSAERESDLSVGTICLARAVKAVPSGWFLEVENGKTVYLNTPSFFIKPDGSVRRVPLSEGDRLVVEISRPAIEDKYPEARVQVSLAGKFVVFQPWSDKPSFSKRLDEEAVKRLRPVVSGGVKVRTAAQNETESDILSEIEALRLRWRELLRASGREGILHRPEKAVFAWAERYEKELTQIVTDDARTAAILRERFSKVSFCVQGVWAAENMDEALDTALAEKSFLPSGGFLITQQAAACVCFDVNAGAGAISVANAEACPEIARQIGLKGLGGVMVVDFAGRKEKKFLQEAISRLKKYGLFVAGVTPSGLVELNAEKKRCSVFEAFAVDRSAANLIRRLWFASPTGRVRVSAPVSVLNTLRPYLRQLETRLGTDVELISSEAVGLEGVR